MISISEMIHPIRHVNITRYLTPLREGGSLPAITEADDGFLYVTKFRGAGQGTKALVADFIGGMFAKVAGFFTPELVFCYLDESYGRTEPDEEIQDLLKFSTGLNLGVHYLSGAITFDPAATEIEPQTASRIVWLDYLLTNVDRTYKNTNMLVWKGDLWLIDHGASLYFHHNWDNRKGAGEKSFQLIKDHVLFGKFSDIDLVNEWMLSRITPEVIDQVVGLIPDDWLTAYKVEEDPEAIRSVYSEFLKTRIHLVAAHLKSMTHG